MPERLAKSISAKAEIYFEGMANAPKGIEWIKNNNEEFEKGLVPAFAEVIREFNKLVQGDQVPEHLINLKYFHNKEITIPHLTEIKRYYATNAEHFLEILEQAKTRMERGTFRERKSEYFTFHLDDKIPPKAMAAVEVFEITEMLCQGLSDKVKPEYEGQLTNALIEMLCEIGPENSLFDLIANPENANFVIDYDGFSPKLKQKVAAHYPIE